MMTPSELARTVYLGDRTCKRIVIDGWRRALSIEIDLISRIRNPSGKWNFYSDEDIVGGLIVFDGLVSFEFEPQGFVPSDWIEIIGMEEVSGTPGTGPHVRGTLSLGAVDASGNAQEVTLKVCAAAFYLLDPARPEVKIVE